MAKCRHEPNEETARTLKEPHEEESEVFDTVDGFWESMGINPHDEDYSDPNK